LPGCDAFRTPLGDVPVVVRGGDGNAIVPAAHTREHSLEVQLPFLQTVLDEFELIPLTVGEADPEDVADALERFGTDADTLIVISSDLSHYLSYDQARRVDTQTAELIEALQGESLRRDSACGLRGIQGLLLFARQHGLRVRLLDLRNSGDTQGDRSRVVGYGAFWVG
jgi:AmmeMemoRadiSam system protein B